MKPIYRCEYCDVTGTEEEIREHEEKCAKNYNKRSCLTCKHCSTDGFSKIECKNGKEVPEGKMFERCPAYENGKIEVSGFMKMFDDFFN